MPGLLCKSQALMGKELGYKIIMGTFEWVTNKYKPGKLPNSINVLRPIEIAAFHLI